VFSVPNTLFHIQDCLYGRYVEHTTHSCIHSSPAEEEHSDSQNVEDIKIKN